MEIFLPFPTTQPSSRFTISSSSKSCFRMIINLSSMLIRTGIILYVILHVRTRPVWDPSKKAPFFGSSYAIESCKSSVENRLRGRQRENYEKKVGRKLPSPADEIFSFMFQEFAMNGTRTSVWVRRAARISAKIAGNLEISVRLHSGSSASHCCCKSVMISIDVEKIENTHHRIV